MLRPDQIEVLQEQATQLLDPVVEYLIREIAARVAQAGQLTATAQYQVWRAQQLGVSQYEIKRRVAKLLKISQNQAEQLFRQMAETGYRYDLERMPTRRGIPFKENTLLQQIVSASAQMAKDGLSNITQTMGFVGPDGRVEELTQAFIKACDFAFMQATTGATDPVNAVRKAVAGLRSKGIQFIDYESGKSYSVEAAVRRNVWSAAGMMQERLSQQVFDDIGADGWEISAHAASAPDHEPIQGKQYPADEYKRLNNSLVRRIGTLNCGHTASPIVLGISKPIYTKEQLEALRDENEKGIEYNGKHYTMYQATQKQRKIEREIRETKRRILIDEETKDSESLMNDRVKYQLLRQEYKRFNDASGLRPQYERAEMAGFGPKQANASEKEYIEVANKANALYDTGTEEGNVIAYQRDLPIREAIKTEYSSEMREGRQNGHFVGTNEYKNYVEKQRKIGLYGPSIVTVTKEDLKLLYEKYRGTGILVRKKSGDWDESEIITMNETVIGQTVNLRTDEHIETSCFQIHYSKEKGWHIVPEYSDMFGKKEEK